MTGRSKICLSLTRVGPSRVQTFNSCTSRPDVYQCLIVQKPAGNMSTDMSIKMPSTAMTQVACESKVCSVVRSSLHPAPGCGSQTDVQSCIMPGLQEFSDGIKCRHCRSIYCFSWEIQQHGQNVTLFLPLLK